MLILTRKLGESLLIGNDIRITVTEIKGKNVRIGIKAPVSIPVYREEIYHAVLEENRLATTLTEIGDKQTTTMLGKLLNRYEMKEKRLSEGREEGSRDK